MLDRSVVVDGGPVEAGNVFEQLYSMMLVRTLRSDRI
jgi:hypothetical protein